MQPRARRWCFTWNNYDEQFSQHIFQNIVKTGKVLKIIAGREVAPGTGTSHLQGYIAFTQQLYRRQVVTMLGGTVHVEVARGNEQQNIAYCSKDGNIAVDWQSPAYSQARADAKEVKKLDKQEYTRDLLDALMTMSINDFEARYPYEALHWKEKLAGWKIAHTDLSIIWNGTLKKKNTWLWGAPGTGKSRWARAVSKGFDYPKNLNKWWDGYDIYKHRTVVIEDIDPSHGKWIAQFLKIWGDRYPFIGETKGSNVLVQPGSYFLIITSNFGIDEVFENQSDRDAIRRRFSELHVTGPQDIIFQKQLDFTKIEIPKPVAPTRPSE